MLHHFHIPVADIPLPERFTFPFCYTPHPLCVAAAKEVQAYLGLQEAWKEELAQGKMFGVLVVRTQEGETGYLAAFSGILAGSNVHPFFVPPVYDLVAAARVLQDRGRTDFANQHAHRTVGRGRRIQTTGTTTGCPAANCPRNAGRSQTADETRQRETGRAKTRSGFTPTVLQ